MFPLALGQRKPGKNTAIILAQAEIEESKQYFSLRKAKQLDAHLRENRSQICH